MYKLSDKESPYIYINCSSPCSWLALSNKSGNDVTDALVKRAYAAVSCRNPLLRAVHKPEIDKFSLVIRGTEEIIQDEVGDKLPAHVTKEYHTREEAWTEYKKEMENSFWKCDYMWEVLVCVLDKESPSSSDTKYVIFGHFNHGVVDGAAVMAVLNQFIQTLNYGLTNNTLPSHNYLGESTPVPKPFSERYPLFKFIDSISDDEKEDLFAKVNENVKIEKDKLHCAVIDKMFTEEATKRFIAKCKKHSVSFTAGLFAAIALTASVKKIAAVMPLSFRTKDNWGEVAVSFIDSTFSLDLTSIWENDYGEKEKDDDVIWAALAKEFHREIHRKMESPEEKYRGAALNYVKAALEDEVPAGDGTMCTGPNKDELSICVSNVGVMDRYFKDEEGPLGVTEVTGFCSNSICPNLMIWCYTFRGRFRVNLINTTRTLRKDVLEDFADKVFRYFEKN